MNQHHDTAQPELIDATDGRGLDEIRSNVSSVTGFTARKRSVSISLAITTVCLFTLCGIHDNDAGPEEPNLKNYSPEEKVVADIREETVSSVRGRDSSLGNFPLFPSSYRDIFPAGRTIGAMRDFWIRICAEYSFKQVVIHDRDNPSIIYGDVNFKGRTSGEGIVQLYRKRERLENAFQMIREEPESLWTDEAHRVVRLFDRFADRDFLDGAEDRIRYQRGLKEPFRRGLERSTRYLDTVRVILDAYRLPHLLAYLPHVESAFDPLARSKVGALGMWQFMLATGKEYMIIDSLIDERLDPIRSTHAAAQLLTENHRFLETWPLAITAYNHGRFGMKRAKEQTGTSDLDSIVRSYRGRSFGFASKNFYACFLAAVAIAENSDHYFKNLDWHSPVPMKAVKLVEPAPFFAVTGFFRIPQADFRKHNPALLDKIFINWYDIPAKYTVNIPAETEMVLDNVNLHRKPEKTSLDWEDVVYFAPPATESGPATLSLNLSSTDNPVFVIGDFPWRLSSVEETTEIVHSEITSPTRTMLTASLED